MYKQQEHCLWRSCPVIWGTFQVSIEYLSEKVLHFLPLARRLHHVVEGSTHFPAVQANTNIQRLIPSRPDVLAFNTKFAGKSRGATETRGKRAKELESPHCADVPCRLQDSRSPSVSAWLIRHLRTRWLYLLSRPQCSVCPCQAYNVL
jgi:hypothetical protein